MPLPISRKEAEILLKVLDGIGYAGGEEIVTLDEDEDEVVDALKDKMREFVDG